MTRHLAAGVMAGIFAGFAVGLLPSMLGGFWLTHQPWWPLGESLTFPLVWGLCGLDGGAVGALCGWYDHRRSARKKKS